MVELKNIPKVKKDPFIDIIMPNYNKGQFLEESVNSVISQKYKNWNLFIIDNASNDNSKNVLDILKNLKHNINLICLSKNKGVAFSRNLGLRLSKSEYISFLDSDDYWLPNKLEDQINFMENFNYNFTYTDYTPFISKNGVKIFKKAVIPRSSFNFDQFINDTSIHTSTMIIKKSIIKTTKFPKIKTLEDYPFKCKILKTKSLANKLKQDLMFYRISENSLQSNKLRNVYWLWYINKKYNKLSLLKNIMSILMISISSIKKYGFK